MGEIPHLKALVQRHADAPFALLGVNTDSGPVEYRKKAIDHGVTWRSAWQGSTEGPIPTTWGIDGYPTIFVLDAKHVIRAVDVSGNELSKLVRELLAELEDG